jgi:GH15 family glucan-1,4-alpha-glucosidase
MAIVDDMLARRSLDVLKAGQAPSGAFVASPSFPTYGYAWLRDGSFCAHALDVVGERDAAAAFHRWVAQSVEAHRDLIESAVHRVGNGETPPHDAMPPARYTLDGTLERADDEPWPNFQVDGYGMWLWALDAHLAGATPDPALARTVALVGRYLAASWRLKCFNCWEEFDDGEHASTLGAVVAGIEAAARLLEAPHLSAEAAAVRARLLDAHVVDGRFARGSTDARLDGSLLWLSVPFGVLPADDPRIVATVEAIRRDLTGPSGGVYRYRGDTYYGGGEWLLLTSSLAWHDAVTGNRAGYAEAQDWVRSQALANGDMTEQVTDAAQEPDMVEPWVRRWGPVATPLLWSHAMYLIAEAADG